MDKKVCCVCDKEFIMKNLSQISCSRSCKNKLLSAKVRKDLLPTTSVTNLDIAWAAGIFEGEGYAHCIKRGSSSLATGARITQKQVWLLQKMKSLFGGSITKYVRKSDNRTYYRWQSTGSLARGYLMTIYQFLSPHKKEQIRLALGRNG